MSLKNWKQKYYYFFLKYYLKKFKKGWLDGWLEEENEEIEFHDWTLKDIEKFEKSVLSTSNKNNEQSKNNEKGIKILKFLSQFFNLF